MEKKQHSAKFLRKRKLMMALPLLVIPFLTMAFWALGGGAGENENKVADVRGLNLELPDAKLKDESAFDKLSFYKQAEADSAKMKEALKNDPYYRNNLDEIATTSGISGLNTSVYGTGNPDANASRVYQKIEELNQQINQPVPVQSTAVARNTTSGGDVQRLEEMMQMMNAPAEEDEEMKQINSVLDKIMDVQHPERIKEKLREQSRKNKGRVYSVSTGQKDFSETILQRNDTIRRKVKNGFYSETNKPLMEVETGSGGTAVVHETQTIVSGSTVKLRLTSDVYINGMLVKAGTFVYGTASLENERLLILVSSINCRNTILPVSLAVHDIDGVAGIYIPGSINRDVAKQSAEQSLSGVDLVSMDPSIGAQAAAAGLNAAKGLLSKKVKLVKVTVKANYRVLLKDNNQQNY